MKILIVGGGWYGCHLARALRGEHDVILIEKETELFKGASGSNPARLHIGPHYPRSHSTRASCRKHSERFMEEYGHLTRPIGRNIYAIAEADSLVDFGTFQQVLRAEIDLIRIYKPAEFGLQHVEGAIIVGERHILIGKAREYFAEALRGCIVFNTVAMDDALEPDLTIDCTFCSEDSTNVERYEPCVTALLEGPVFEAITIMDGPFPSLYPWDEERHLCSLTSAKWTPLARCATWALARHKLNTVKAADIENAAENMVAQMEYYYPQVRDTHRYVGELLGIRAMPRSGADARLVEVLNTAPNRLRIRAGKIDAIFEAERQVREFIGGR